MSDEQKNGDEPQNPGGAGGDADEYPLIGKTKASRIERTAIKQRWPVPEKYRGPIMNRAIANMLEENTSIRDFNQTLNALLRADALNQADEHKQQPDEVNINLTGGVRIIEDDNWYGNSDRFATIAAAASDQDSDGSGPVQGSGGRPPLGKNGDGTTSGD